eukprot:m.36398 g.36398  ORF g.36398 m.36398 type:complete len:85 (-) comp7570_c0_seq1:2884-3138(-)
MASKTFTSCTIWRKKLPAAIRIGKRTVEIPGSNVGLVDCRIAFQTGSSFSTKLVTVLPMIRSHVCRQRFYASECVFRSVTSHFG